MMLFGGKPPLFKTVGGRLIQGTFTRSSPAYLDGVEYAVNTPRFPSQSGIVGVMNEEGTANLLTANQASVETNTVGFASTAGVVLSVDTSRSVVGVACLKVVADGAASGQGFNTGATVSTATPSAAHTASIYLWGVGTVILSLVERNSGAFVGQTNSANIVLTSTPTRYTVTRTFGATGNQASLTATLVQQATTFYADALQIEAKAYATQWQLPGSARAAETLTVPTSGLLTPSQGSVSLDFTVPSLPGASRVLANCAIDSNNFFRLNYDAAGRIYADFRANGVYATTTIASGPVVVPGARTRACIRWTGTTMALFVNGAKVPGSDAALAAFVGATFGALYLGTSTAGATHANAVFHGAHTYLDAVTDAEGVAATAGNPPPDFTAHLNFQTGYVRGFTPGSNPVYDPDLFTPFS